MKSRLVLAAAAMILAGQVARADGASDDVAVRNHIACYPFGIDRIGKGDLPAGLAIWQTCFAPALQFSAYFGRGEPTRCPGEACPFPKDMSPIEMRAALARRAFDTAGFVKTSHHLTNVSVGLDGADKAVVNAYVQAWHWKADNTVVVAPGTWDVELTRIDGQWRISKETLAVVGAAIVPPPAPQPQPAQTK